MEYITIIILLTILVVAISINTWKNTSSSAPGITVEELMMNEVKYKIENEFKVASWKLKQDIWNMEMESNRKKHKEIMEMYFERWEKMGWLKGKEKI